MTVNMSTNPQKIYSDVSILLEDICKFLSEKSLKLTSADKKWAESLIMRSQKQLQEMSKNFTRNENEGYVDMTKKLDTISKSIVIKTLPVNECPFPDLPAKEASEEIKCGHISMRRKMFNIIDCSTKIYAVIHKSWMLLYWSNKESKQFCTLDLKYYEAKEDFSDLKTTDELIRKEGFAKSFQVFSTLKSGMKLYNFNAVSHKDMLDWVVSINRCHNNAILSYKEVLEEQSYDIIDIPSELNDDVENIYNEPDTLRPRLLSNKPKKEDRPPLPAKHPSLSKSRSNESLASYHEVLGSNSCKSNSVKSLEDSSKQYSEGEKTYYELGDVARHVQEIKDDSVNEYVENDTQAPPPLPKGNGHQRNQSGDDQMYENDSILTPPILPTVPLMPSPPKPLGFQKPKVEESPRIKANQNDSGALSPKIKKDWKPFRKSMPKSPEKETSPISNNVSFINKESASPRKSISVTSAKEQSTVMKIIRRKLIPDQVNNLESFSANPKTKERFTVESINDNKTPGYLNTEETDKFMPIILLNSCSEEKSPSKKKARHTSRKPKNTQNQID